MTNKITSSISNQCSHVHYPDLIERLESLNHCEQCPTLHGEKHGCDPEHEAVRNSVELMDVYGPVLYCPWKRCSCPCHSVAWKFHHNRLTEGACDE